MKLVAPKGAVGFCRIIYMEYPFFRCLKKIVITRGIRICWNYVKSLIRRGPPGKINTNFPGRKPPRINTNDFKQRKHIHEIASMSLLETLLDDFIRVAAPPGPPSLNEPNNLINYKLNWTWTLGDEDPISRGGRLYVRRVLRKAQHHSFRKPQPFWKFLASRNSTPSKIPGRLALYAVQTSADCVCLHKTILFSCDHNYLF